MDTFEHTDESVTVRLKSGSAVTAELGFSKHIFLSIFLPQTVRGGDSPLYLYHNAKQAKKYIARPFIMIRATPHVIEPKYPGAFEQIVDLSSCWDEHALFESRELIMALSARISRCHEHCCRFLGAAGSLIGDTYRIALDATSASKVSKAARRLALGAFKGGPEGRGHESVRFLSCVTNKGVLMFEDTARALCDRLYLIDDVYGAVSRLMLNALRSHALQMGWDVITCYCPLSPFEKIDHLFIPALKIGFMTSNDFHKPEIEPYKIIRARRFTDAEQLRAHRKRISFNRKAASQMIDQAGKLLAEAKRLHDQLEQYYRSAMDFEKADDVCRSLLQKYEHILSRYGL